MTHRLLVSNILVVFLVMGAVTVQGTSVQETKQLMALRDLYAATNGPWWSRTLTGWSDPNNTDYCTWSGVLCAFNTTNVESVMLQELNLTGQIPDSFGDLEHVSHLYMAYNNIRGPLPASMSGMTKLAVLHIRFNQLESPLPSPAAWPNLGSIDISDNAFTGPLPSFQGLSKLTTISVRNNAFTGDLSGVLGTHMELRTLDISYLSLTPSEFPDIRSCCGNLTNLDMRYSGDYSKVSDDWFERFLSNVPLHQLQAQANSLPGALADDLSKWPELNILSLSHNQMSGSLPSAIGDSLSVFSVSFNDFSGPLPKWQVGHSQLTMLDVQGNRLTGSVDLSDMQFLSVITLSDNSLDGTLALHKDAVLLNVNVSGNAFTGALPVCVWTGASTMHVDVSGNHFSDLNFPQGGRWPQLFLAANNEFSGALPSLNRTCAGSACPSLKINLANNHITSIPSSLEHACPLGCAVTTIDLSNNLITGTLPSKLPHTLCLDGADDFALILAHNQLEGSIPDSYGSCLGLAHLDVHNNTQLEGTLPSSFIDPITTINAAFCNLEGPVPAKLCDAASCLLMGNPRLECPPCADNPCHVHACDVPPAPPPPPPSPSPSPSPSPPIVPPPSPSPPPPAASTIPRPAPKTGLIVGIVVAVMAGLVCIAAAGVFAFRTWRKRLEATQLDRHYVAIN